MLALATTALLTAGCTANKPVTDYGQPAHDNFVSACQLTTSASRGTTTTQKLAPQTYCDCVYTAMKDKYKLSFDEVMAYEKEVAAAKPGEMPTPPVKLTKSMESCQNVAGPSK